jgi:hypothetical protein
MFKFDKIFKKYIMAFELPQLPYAYDALEPYIDAHDGNSSFEAP